MAIIRQCIQWHHTIIRSCVFAESFWLAYRFLHLTHSPCPETIHYMVEATRQTHMAVQQLQRAAVTQLRGGWHRTQGAGRGFISIIPGRTESLNRWLQHRLFSPEVEHFSTCHDACQAQNTGEGWGPWGLFSIAAPWETHPPPPPCMWEARLYAGRGAWPQAALSAQAGRVSVQRSPEPGSGWKQPPSRRGKAAPKRLHKRIS